MESSVRKYSRDLAAFYDFLPAGKEITRRTMERWRDALLAQGYAPRAVNASVSEANGFLGWLGLREYQLSGQLDVGDDIQPKLTRTEYLRLLSAARAAGRERASPACRTCLAEAAPVGWPAGCGPSAAGWGRKGEEAGERADGVLPRAKKERRSGLCPDVKSFANLDVIGDADTGVPAGGAGGIRFRRACKISCGVP